MSGSNAASLANLEQIIQQKMIVAATASKTALEAARDIGEALIAGKSMVPRGQYGRWTQAKFNKSKTWTAKHCRVAKEWSDLLKSQNWATDQGRVLGPKEYGVEGAVNLIDEYLDATQPGRTDERKAKRPVKADKAFDPKAEIKRLKEEVKAKDQEISLLKHQRSGTVTQKDRNLALKIYTLNQNHAALAGEKASSYDRLVNIADRYGYSYKALLNACGLA